MSQQIKNSHNHKDKNDLDAAIIKATKWSFFEKFGHQLLQFVLSVILARILSPKEFGLIAMMSIFTALGNSFINGGFQKALIQKKDIEDIDKCSVFYFNIVVALIVSSIIWIFAPRISLFYQQPELTLITRFFSLIFLFSAFGLVQDSLFAKSLDFKSMFKINISALSISGLFSIILAINGFGVWSLVFLNISSLFFRTIFLWFYSSWRPSASFSLESLKIMFSFGSYLFIISISNAFFVNIYQVVIGKFFSASSLGIYSRAKTLSMYPLDLISGIINQVSFPFFSKIQTEKKAYLKQQMKETIILTSTITFPVMIGLSIISKPLVIILLTEKWLSSVILLQLLCVAGVFHPILGLNLNVLNAQGHSKQYFKIDLINKILIISFLFFTFKYGIIVMVIGQIVNSVFTYYLYTYFIKKYIGYSFIEQIKDIFPSFLLASIMGLVTFSIKFLIGENYLMLLIFQIPTGIFVYSWLCYFFKVEAFFKLLKLFKPVGNI